MFQKIMKNLCWLPSHGNSSNIFLLLGEKKTVIDTGLESDVMFLETSLKELGVEPSEIDLVLLTHGHADHIGGGSIFLNAEFWASGFDGEKINSCDANFTVANLFNQNYFPKIKNFYSPDQIFGLGSFSLRVIETPGHTKGSVSFFDEKNKLLFSGDTLFNKSIGRYDLLSSNKNELFRSIKKISKLNYQTLLPGHGQPLLEKQKENLELAFSLLE